MGLFAWTPLTNNSQCTSSHHIVTMAAIFEQYRQALEKFLYQDGPLKPYIEKVEAKTGVKRIYLAIGLTVLLSLYLVFGYGAQLLCNLIGFVYPALKSIKAVESVKKEDDTKWLTYWIVFAFLSTLEFFSNLITNFIPFYWLLKCMVLIWCFAPLGAWNGSSKTELQKKKVFCISLLHAVCSLVSVHSHFSVLFFKVQYLEHRQQRFCHLTLEHLLSVPQYSPYFLSRHV